MVVEQPPDEVQPPHEEEPGTEMVLRRFVACPYLGLRHDQTVTAIGPTTAHACYSRRRRYSPSVEHQVIFCFSPIYAQCKNHPDDAPDDIDSMYALVDSEDRSGSTDWLPWAGTALAVILVLAILFLFMSGIAQIQWPATVFPERFLTNPLAATNTQPVNANAGRETATVMSAEERTLLSTPPPSPVENESGVSAQVAPSVSAPPAQQISVTPEPPGQQLSLTPRQVDVGWWVNADSRQAYIGDSFLYAGAVDDDAFISAVRFDLRRIPRGAPILGGTLQLTGSRDVLIDRTADGQGPNASWLAQLIAESDLPELPRSDFLTVFGAPASITLSPQLEPSDVEPGTVNEWVLDESARDWLYQQVLDGATSVTVRLAPFTVGAEALFAWDSGHGSESQGESPVFMLDLGPAPPTPPPTATRPVIIATFTSEPENVLTVVARSAPATAIALQGGTATATQVFVVTPTPLPENLATVQIAAIAERLPAVVLHTPVPANAATAAANTQYATAVAFTTGTFTPVPPDYVTPAVYFPPPPPENVATAAARAVSATAAAVSGAATPTRPWNAVAAVYAFATETPENRVTAIALIQEQNLFASATGTPTSTPWNLVVITRVPQPTSTPIPLVVSAADITPTPSPTPTRQITRNDIEGFRNKILFLSDRSGDDVGVWAMDPESGEVLAMVTDQRVHEQARDLFLPNSPDGKQRVYVQEDANGALQIKVEEFEYGTVHQVTNFHDATSYDPAWSPIGNQIAFVSTESDGDEIYVVSPEEGDPTRLTFNTWEWDKHPTWSPDGRQIVFFSNRETGRKQLWIMNADGSNPRNLSNNEYNDWDPVWIR